MASFEDAIHLYHRTIDVDQFNHRCQRDSGQPVIKVRAIHPNNDRVAAEATASEAGHLEAELALSIGCKLMILENIWTERGIVNGTECRLYDIVWPEHAEPRADQPLCLLVAVPKGNYHGPWIETYTWKGHEYSVIPIYPSQRDFFKGGEVRYRTQFPVKLAYALTIHKAQGMTMPKVVLNLAMSAPAAVVYVAVSRVKRLEDLLFEESFGLDKLQGSGGTGAEMRKQDWERRALQRLISSNQAVSQEYQRQQRRRRVWEEAAAGEEDPYPCSQPSRKRTCVERTSRVSSSLP